MAEFEAKIWHPIVRKVLQVLIQLETRKIAGEETAKDGSNVLEPFRVIFLCRQLGYASQVAEDEEYVLDSEEGALEHVFQTQ